MKTCVWREDKNMIWKTDCGNLFEFMKGKNSDTEEFFYCIFCGRKLETKPFSGKSINEIKLENTLLKTELDHANKYADKLAAGLPCLPKDVEVLRTANSKLAQENFELRERLRNKLIVF